MRPPLSVLACALACAIGAGATGARGDEAEPAEPVEAAPSTPPDPPDEVVLLPRDARLSVRWADAPALAPQLARVVLADLDHARGLGDRLSLVGDPPAELPPPGWPLPLDGGTAGPQPIGAGDDCACATRLPLAPDRRIAALWAVGGFTLAGDAGDLRVLEVRARYQDGLAVWLNGIPIVRRGLAADGHPLRLAERPHGPEWETVYVPVVPGLLRAGDNLVAVEVHPGERSAAPRLELELTARRARALVRGPMVQRVTPTTATIVVETDLPADVSLAWGPTEALGQTVAAAPARRHELALTGLPPGGVVHYQVTVDGVPGPRYRFATAPGPGEVLRLVVYGDVRGGHATHARLVEAIAAEAPDLVVASGDLVLRGHDEGDWQRFFTVAAPLLATTPYYAAIGNHDLGRSGELGRRMTELFAFPAAPADRPAHAGWYGFDVAGVHLVMLDSNAYDDARQRTWLEADLRAARAAGARAILAFTHDGPFSRGYHGGNQVAARDYVPILAGAGVTALFSGHDHLYQRGRKDGLAYVVTGGGGAGLYAVACGVRGKPRCRRDDGMLHVAREHHYVLVTVYPGHVELCPRRPDGSALEPCVTYPLPTMPARVP